MNLFLEFILYALGLVLFAIIVFIFSVGWQTIGEDLSKLIWKKDKKEVNGK